MVHRILGRCGLAFLDQELWRGTGLGLGDRRAVAHDDLRRRIPDPVDLLQTEGGLVELRQLDDVVCAQADRHHADLGLRRHGTRGGRNPE